MPGTMVPSGPYSPATARQEASRFCIIWFDIRVKIVCTLAPNGPRGGRTSSIVTW